MGGKEREMLGERTGGEGETRRGQGGIKIHGQGQALSTHQDALHKAGGFKSLEKSRLEAGVDLILGFLPSVH